MSISQTSRRQAEAILSGLDEIECAGAIKIRREFERCLSITVGIAYGVKYDYIKSLTSDGRYALDEAEFEIKDLVRLAKEGHREAYPAMAITYANWRALELARQMALTLERFRSLSEDEVRDRLKGLGYSDVEETYNKGQGSYIDFLLRQIKLPAEVSA
jgi:hypothetical protein